MRSLNPGLTIIDEIEDCLRFYRITEPVQMHVTEHGRFRAADFEGPLVV